MSRVTNAWLALIHLPARYVREFVFFFLNGRIRVEEVTGLQKLFKAGRQDHRIVLVLKEVELVDQDAVMFLARCEADGAQLENCPAYIREWILIEKDRS